VVIDLRRLAFIDARSAGAIAVASERMAGWGGRLAARMPSPAVRRAFEGCGLGELLTPRETRDSGRSSAAVALR
jgi:anti-anti-sigma factor